MKLYKKAGILILWILCLSAALGLYGCSGKKNADTGKEPDISEAPDKEGSKDASDKNLVTNTENNMENNTENNTNMITIQLDPAFVGKSPAVLNFSEGSGVYKEEFELKLTCDKAVEIYYTTDGSNPVTSTKKMLYNGPIKITDRRGEPNYMTAVDPFLFDAANVKVNQARDGFVSSLDSRPSDEDVDKCTVIRAIAVDDKGDYTAVATNTYFVGAMTEHIIGIKESCKASGTSLAVLSLSVNYEDLFDPETGIYVKGNIFDKALKEYLASGGQLKPDTSRQLDANYKQKGKEWERSIHLDFFESDGTTTTCALQQDCGVRIQGNYSRSDLQKGLRLYADKDYGKKEFEYAFFGAGLKNSAGETISKFKSITLRNGGNCAFTTKFSDTYWQSLIKDLDCETQTSRPCIVYINGEYWGLYVLQEDYSEDYFKTAHGVKKDDVVAYKGDAEALKELGYKLDLGKLPEGVTDENYYFYDLWDFFSKHKDLSEKADYEEFAKLVDVESVRDYFAVEIWINNKWDWPGKNWTMWKTKNVDKENPYADGRWRFCFYDIEFGGVSGASDAYTNTIKDDNYMPHGLLDKDTTNPAVLCYAYLMTNENFRKDFAASLLTLGDKNFKLDTATAALTTFRDTYSPLYDQFFARYKGTGSSKNSIDGGYASYKCILDFLNLRAGQLQPMLDYADNYFKGQ